MNMKIFSLESEIILSEEYISVLQIKNRKLFARIVQSVYQKINGEEKTVENIILLDGDKEIKFQKEVQLILDIFNYDCNQRKIQNALYQYILKIYQVEYDRLYEFKNILRSLEVQASDVWDELPFEFEYKEEIEVTDYLKFIGLKIRSEEDSLIKKIFNIIDIVEYFKVAKVVMFVNIKSFFGQHELLELYKYILYKKVKVLFLETGEEQKPLKDERIWLVDDDYDEIMLYNKY